MGVGTVSEAQFIYLGMTKEKWPHLTIETIQGYLNDPSWLDDDNDAFNKCFHFYHDWYWRDQRSKQ